MSEIARLTTALPYQLPRAASGVTEPEILGEPKDRSVLASMGATLLPMASPSASALSATGEATDLLTWSTDDPATATQSNSATSAGVATGVSEGSCLITAVDPVTGLNATRTLHVNFFLYLLGQGGELIGRDIDLTAQTSVPTPNFAYVSSNPVRVLVDPSGRYLILVDGPLIGIFLIDPATGALAFTDLENVAATSTAVRNVAFEPRGRFFYASGDNDQLYLWSFDAASGQANFILQGPVLTNTTGLVVHPNSRFVALANGTVQGIIEVDPDSGVFIQVTNFFQAPQTNATWSFYPGETILYGDYSVARVDPAVGSSILLGFVISGGPQISLAISGAQRYLFSPNRANGARSVLAYLVGAPGGNPGQLDPLPGSPYPTGGDNPPSGGIPLQTTVHPNQGILFVVTNVDIEWHSISDRLRLVLRDPLAMSPAVSAAGTP